MAFHSIIFEIEGAEEDRRKEPVEAPPFFVDLNLDQVIDAITANKALYNLKPLFYTSLNNLAAVEYRHEIMGELEEEYLIELINSFAQMMVEMREHLALADKLYYKYQKERWFLNAVEIYCDAVNSLAAGLSEIELKSRGFVAFREFLDNYIRTERFTSLLSETKQLKADLAAIKYCLLIRGNAIRVRKYEGEIDYSTEVEKTFDKFKQGAVNDYRVKLPFGKEMDHVEAGVLELVARLFPDIFSNLDTFCAKNGNFLDEALAKFDREIQFYIAYLEYMALFQQNGLKFCYPNVTQENKNVYDYEGFDLALAAKLITENSPVVCNDFYLKEQERILVVTGPNQGGKTTFARTFGQLHYLAGLGCPVPGGQAQLFLADKIFTHFEKEENIHTLSGKLQDELVRIYRILNLATSHSIIIMNEIFTSTTLEDAIF